MEVGRVLKAVFIGALLLGLVPANAAAQAGQPGSSGDAAGKALWEGPGIECRFCHGVQGEGAWGPALAGRELTSDSFLQGLRRPNMMPAYGDTHITDREAASMLAHLNSLPRAPQPGRWRVQLPENAPNGQRAAIATAGCAQCHGLVFGTPRQSMGAVAGDFEWFKRIVYEHTTAMPEYWKAVGQTPSPRMIMGNYSPVTLPESLLREIYDWAKDLGVRAPIAGRLSAGVEAANGVTYTLNVDNAGARGRGVDAENLTIALRVPAGATVAGATGPGYKGIRRDEEAKADLAEWQLPRLAVAERQTFTITLSAAATADNPLRGTISWARPAVKTAPLDTINIFPVPGGGPPR